ncbi:hypothetical protein I4U23_031427 [Adineta vaga]|nr:hypothetical protein I4U23_031427 [Adineta vaga]
MQREMRAHAINNLDNNQFMTLKRSDGSILDFCSVKSKVTALYLSTEEIALVNLSNVPTSSQHENTEILSTAKMSTFTTCEALDIVM